MTATKAKESLSLWVEKPYIESVKPKEKLNMATTKTKKPAKKKKMATPAKKLLKKSKAK